MESYIILIYYLNLCITGFYINYLVDLVDANETFLSGYEGLLSIGILFLLSINFSGYSFGDLNGTLYNCLN